MKEVGWEAQTCEKAFINALFLAYRNFANSKIKSMNMAMVDVPRVYSIPMLYPYMNIVWMLWLHIYISAWGSALLVQLDWAMRRPLYAGRVMIQAPALFLYGCTKENTIRTVQFGELADKRIVCKQC